MAENQAPPSGPGFMKRWLKKSSGSLATNKFELQRFGFFVAVPIAVWWMFSDNDRVERMYQIFKPHTTQPAPVLQSMPDNFLERFGKGEDAMEILRSHGKEQEAKKERQKAQLEELRQQQERYNELKAKQSVSEQ